MISRLPRRGLLLAGAFAFLTVVALPASAQPGFSPLDKSNPSTSKQDNNLKPHPTDRKSTRLNSSH